MRRSANRTLKTNVIISLVLIQALAACGRDNGSSSKDQYASDAMAGWNNSFDENEDPVRIPDPVDAPANPPVDPAAPPATPDVDPATISTALAPNPQGVAMKDFERRVIELTNAERQKRGLGILTVNGHLLDNCRRWAGNMANRRSMYHSNMDFGGENVAWNQSNAEEVVTAWMNSPGHRANILRPGFKSIGVGMARSNGPYWCQQFGW
jgi:uncharacterized protein YkwD